MKNKFLIITLLLTANAGFCETAARSAVVNSAIIKFTLAMVGVIVSSIVIYVGLAIYDKFFVNRDKIEFSTEENFVQKPKNIDEAIRFFINKNRLR